MSELQRNELSDEDQDIDIESDDDDTNSSTGGAYETADKKAHHNALERKRRDHIKESFNGLRDCLPGVKRDKPSASRAMILKQATDYIQHMMRKTSVCQNDIDNMRKQNQLLKQQVKLAERKRKQESNNGESSQSSYNMGGCEQSESSDNSSDHDLKIKPRVQTKGGHKRTRTN